MSAVAFTAELSRAYRETFITASIRPQRAQLVAGLAGRIWHEPAASRYRAVTAATGVPAYLVGILHNLECGGNFHGHLHNGDPLTARTVRVPTGRPATGRPPFSWEESAVDALRLKGLDRWTDWSIPGIAYTLERYNGFGYRNRHPSIPSPYLWSFTTAYVSGKYVADHVWSATAVSQQCGGMALLRAMFEAGMLTEAAGGMVLASTPKPEMPVAATPLRETRPA